MKRKTKSGVGIYSNNFGPQKAMSGEEKNEERGTIGTLNFLFQKRNCKLLLQNQTSLFIV